jgi:acetyl esterase/lipase
MVRRQCTTTDLRPSAPSPRILSPTTLTTAPRATLPACLAALAALTLFPHQARTQSPQLMTPADLIEMAADVPAPAARISYGDAPHQFGRLRLPDGPGPHPLVIAIHGGCYLSMYDIEHFAPLEQGLADAGYAVWSIEYRRVGDEGGGWPNSFLDVAAGVDFARELLGRERLNLDGDRVYTAGHSAGANYAIWAAARPRIDPTSEVWVEDPLPIRGVLGLAPAATLGALHASGVCGGVLDGLLGGSPEAFPKRYDAVSPMRLMPEGVPQRLVVGALDRSWAPAGRAYHDAAVADGGSPVSMVVAPESGHFEMIAPGTTTWRIVLEELARLTGR